MKKVPKQGEGSGVYYIGDPYFNYCFIGLLCKPGMFHGMEWKQNT